MKKSLMLLLCAVLSHLAVAQSGRFVNGVVFDENDSPMYPPHSLRRGVFPKVR